MAATSLFTKNFLIAFILLSQRSSDASRSTSFFNNVMSSNEEKSQENEVNFGQEVVSAAAVVAEGHRMATSPFSKLQEESSTDRSLSRSPPPPKGNAGTHPRYPAPPIRREKSYVNAGDSKTIQPAVDTGKDKNGGPGTQQRIPTLRREKSYVNGGESNMLQAAEEQKTRYQSIGPRQPNQAGEGKRSLYHVGKQFPPNYATHIYQ
ncbi:unnamed protein product [Cuscuta epithymum]|uniref:Uncharacterized protein n=1 Tax=Cuscuta epithymum TaxID=186058 RepID=A0AAV0FQI5_9ASTE|nr:unnamed protein product [Cuscuta epithymum]